MVSCIGVVLIFGKLLISWVEDLPDNSTQQLMGGVAVLGVLSALLGVPFFDGFLCLCRLYRKMKERTKKQRE